MTIDFRGKTVLVTGASRGIGRATAIMFAECNARVIIHYRKNRKEALKTIEMMPGKNHIVAKADLSDKKNILKFAEDLMSKVGNIHILVNNAGMFEEVYPVAAPFHDWLDNWERTINLNLLGPAHLSFCIARQMTNGRGGKIINVSSRGAFRGEPDAAAYAASKAGLNAFGQSMAKALAPFNVYVYTVAPGFVETEMAAEALEGEAGNAIREQSPMKRVAKPEEVARAIIMLASQGTEYMTGCILDINGASYLRS